VKLMRAGCSLGGGLKKWITTSLQNTDTDRPKRGRISKDNGRNGCQVKDMICVVIACVKPDNIRCE